MLGCAVDPLRIIDPAEWPEQGCCVFLLAIRKSGDKFAWFARFFRRNFLCVLKSDSRQQVLSQVGASQQV